MNFFKSCFDKLVILKRTLTILRLSELSFKKGSCPLCGNKFFVRLRKNDPMAIRCLRCRASIASMSIGYVLKEKVSDFNNKNIYELSSRGPFLKFLKKNCKNLTFTEFFEKVPPGQYHRGIQCQDVQNLTYPDNCFDICTCTEVFEHVPDDVKGFREIYRVLKEKGLFIFTVPLNINKQTLERARLVNNKVEHFLKPEFHDDRIRGAGTVLCFRNYGFDIVERITSAGFKSAEVLEYCRPSMFNTKRYVVVGYK